MKITRTSPFSGTTRTMEIAVTEEQLKKWSEGMLIQHAMPDLTADEREFIKTGISSDEWESIFTDTFSF